MKWDSYHVYNSFDESTADQIPYPFVCLQQLININLFTVIINLTRTTYLILLFVVVLLLLLLFFLKQKDE